MFQQEMMYTLFYFPAVLSEAPFRKQEMRDLSNAPKRTPNGPMVMEEWGEEWGKVLQHSPVPIPGQAGGFARRRCQIRNRRVRKPPPTHFHEFRAAGEGGGARRHLGRCSGSGREGGGRRAEGGIISRSARSFLHSLGTLDGGSIKVSNSHSKKQKQRLRQRFPNHGVNLSIY